MPKMRRASVAEGNVQKKHALSLSEGFVQQGRSHFDARRIHGVREHGKMATSLCQGYGKQGTPLACLP